jgi:hypothetical protein
MTHHGILVVSVCNGRLEDQHLLLRAEVWQMITRGRWLVQWERSHLFLCCFLALEEDRVRKLIILSSRFLTHDNWIKPYVQVKLATNILDR